MTLELCRWRTRIASGAPRAIWLAPAVLAALAMGALPACDPTITGPEPSLSAPVSPP